MSYRPPVTWSTTLVVNIDELPPACWPFSDMVEGPSPIPVSEAACARYLHVPNARREASGPRSLLDREIYNRARLACDSACDGRFFTSVRTMHSVAFVCRTIGEI
jgi:hypothetical protein